MFQPTDRRPILAEKQCQGQQDKSQTVRVLVSPGGASAKFLSLSLCATVCIKIVVFLLICLVDHLIIYYIFRRARHHRLRSSFWNTTKKRKNVVDVAITVVYCRRRRFYFRVVGTPLEAKARENGPTFDLESLVSPFALYFIPAVPATFKASVCDRLYLCVNVYIYLSPHSIHIYIAI